MEDVYTIKVKTKPDTRNLYPSERRYSASTVSGLAWVHIALAATSFLLACLALVNPPEGNPSNTSEVTNLTNSSALSEVNNATNEFGEEFENATVGNDETSNSNYILVLAPTLITIFGLAAGVTSILASVRWYIDRNITWLFVMSVLSTLVSFSSFILIAVWFVNTTDGDISEFYKDKVPFKDFIVVKHTDVLDRNESHMIVALNQPDDKSPLFTKRVLSINILIAAFLELLWSILSVKISYKGMRNNYKDDSNERRGNAISVVTTIKGNDPKNLPRNGKLLQPKPDLIEHYPSKKIKRIFLAQSDNGFYLKNQNNKTKPNTETSSEFYKERMMNFLNRCASLEGVSNPDRTPSVQSESVLNPIPEVVCVEVNLETNPDPEVKDRITPVSWGDSPNHTIYNQNNINFDRIFDFSRKTDKQMESEQRCEDISENKQNN